MIEPHTPSGAEDPRVQRRLRAIERQRARREKADRRAAQRDAGRARRQVIAALRSRENELKREIRRNAGSPLLTSLEAQLAAVRGQIHELDTRPHDQVVAAPPPFEAVWFDAGPAGDPRDAELEPLDVQWQDLPTPDRAQHEYDEARLGDLAAADYDPLPASTTLDEDTILVEDSTPDTDSTPVEDRAFDEVDAGSFGSAPAATGYDLEDLLSDSPAVADPADASDESSSPDLTGAADAAASPELPFVGFSPGSDPHRAAPHAVPDELDDPAPVDDRVTRRLHRLAQRRQQIEERVQQRGARRLNSADPHELIDQAENSAAWSTTSTTPPPVDVDTTAPQHVTSATPEHEPIVTTSRVEKRAARRALREERQAARRLQRAESRRARVLASESRRRTREQARDEEQQRKTTRQEARRVAIEAREEQRTAKAQSRLARQAPPVDQPAPEAGPVDHLADARLEPITTTTALPTSPDPTSLTSPTATVTDDAVVPTEPVTSPAPTASRPLELPAVHIASEDLTREELLEREATARAERLAAEMDLAAARRQVELERRRTETERERAVSAETEVETTAEKLSSFEARRRLSEAKAASKAELKRARKDARRLGIESRVRSSGASEDEMRELQERVAAADARLLSLAEESGMRIQQLESDLEQVRASERRTRSRTEDAVPVDTPETNGSDQSIDQDEPASAPEAYVEATTPEEALAAAPFEDTTTFEDITTFEDATMEADIATDVDTAPALLHDDQPLDTPEVEQRGFLAELREARALRADQRAQERAAAEEERRLEELRRTENREDRELSDPAPTPTDQRDRQARAEDRAVRKEERQARVAARAEERATARTEKLQAREARIRARIEESLVASLETGLDPEELPVVIDASPADRPDAPETGADSSSARSDRRARRQALREARAAARADRTNERQRTRAATEEQRAVVDQLREERLAAARAAREEAIKTRLAEKTAKRTAPEPDTTPLSDGAADERAEEFLAEELLAEELPAEHHYSAAPHLDDIAHGLDDTDRTSETPEPDTASFTDSPAARVAPVLIDAAAPEYPEIHVVHEDIPTVGHAADASVADRDRVDVRIPAAPTAEQVDDVPAALTPLPRLDVTELRSTLLESVPEEFQTRIESWLSDIGAETLERITQDDILRAVHILEDETAGDDLEHLRNVIRERPPVRITFADTLAPSRTAPAPASETSEPEPELRRESSLLSVFTRTGREERREKRSRAKIAREQVRLERTKVKTERRQSLREERSRRREERDESKIQRSFARVQGLSLRERLVQARMQRQSSRALRAEFREREQLRVRELRAAERQLKAEVKQGKRVIARSEKSQRGLERREDRELKRTQRDLQRDEKKLDRSDRSEFKESSRSRDREESRIKKSQDRAARSAVKETRRLEKARSDEETATRKAVIDGEAARLRTEAAQTRQQVRSIRRLERESGRLSRIQEKARKRAEKADAAAQRSAERARKREQARQDMEAKAAQSRERMLTKESEKITKRAARVEKLSRGGLPPSAPLLPAPGGSYDWGAEAGFLGGSAAGEEIDAATYDLPEGLPNRAR